jgi:hypothetical protein
LERRVSTALHVEAPAYSAREPNLPAAEHLRASLRGLLIALLCVAILAALGLWIVTAAFHTALGSLA